MKKYYWTVIMNGYTAKVWAFNEEEAKILGQAEAIKEGKNYEIIQIIKKQNV